MDACVYRVYYFYYTCTYIIIYIIYTMTKTHTIYIWICDYCIHAFFHALPHYDLGKLCCNVCRVFNNKHSTVDMHTLHILVIFMYDTELVCI